MATTDLRRIRVDVSVGIFLVGSGILIHVLFDESVYGMACFVVGMVFIAKAIADGRIAAEE
jgi:hypothetical protein